MSDNQKTHDEYLSSLSVRSQEIFRILVDHYVQTGNPLGSRQLSKMLPQSLSPASVRNVMSDLEDLGLIAGAHISAGRTPTNKGLRFFVDAMLETSTVAERERADIAKHIQPDETNQSVEKLLTQATEVLSNMSQSAGVVITKKTEMVLKHIEFVRLNQDKGMAILVGSDGTVENRIFELPAGLTASALSEASNYLATKIVGHTLFDATRNLSAEITNAQKEFDSLTANLIEKGIASLIQPENDQTPTLIVRGQANLIDQNMATDDLARVRELIDELEEKRVLVELLKDTEQGDGIKIYIGSENKQFSLSGSSVILAPYRDAKYQIVGVLGVIGPTRLNYARIIPAVDYTAKMITDLIRG